MSVSILSDYMVYRDWAPGYHLTNMILFGLLLALSYLLYQRLGASRASLWALAFLALEDIHLGRARGHFLRCWRPGTAEQLRIRFCQGRRKHLPSGPAQPTAPFRCTGVDCQAWLCRYSYDCRRPQRAALGAA
jgi:hypothetical protein